MIGKNIVLASFLISLFWAIMPILYKIILVDVTVDTVFFTYYLLSFAFAFILFLIFRNRINLDFSKFTFKKVVIFITAIIFTSLAANYLYWNLLKNQSIYLVTILIAIFPIFTILIAYWFLKEPISFKVWIGIILAIVGLVIISLNA